MLGLLASWRRLSYHTAMTSLIVIAHNIRSIHNVGSIFRTCEGFGVEKLYLSGYTPYPSLPHDERPPHIRQKLSAALAKTALGAETMLPWQHQPDPVPVLQRYRSQGYTIAALEQTPQAILLPVYTPPQKLVLLLGEEVHGISDDLLRHTDVAVEIPMVGGKESFNVSVATGIALYAFLVAKP